jgi:hypothetical protein
MAHSVLFAIAGHDEHRQAHGDQDHWPPSHKQLGQAEVDEAQVLEQKKYAKQNQCDGGNITSHGEFLLFANVEEALSQGLGRPVRR